MLYYVQGVPKTWKFSDELEIVFVMNQHCIIPNFKSHNIMSARVYLIKRVKDCKDVNIMSPQDEQ